MLLLKKTNLDASLLIIIRPFQTFLYQYLHVRLLQSNLLDMYQSSTPSALRRPQRTDLSWLSSYLTHRSYSVSVGHFKSEKVSISCGVPQGSTLGLLMFNLSTLPPVCIINKHNIPYHSWRHPNIHICFCCPPEPWEDKLRCLWIHVSMWET